MDKPTMPSTPQCAKLSQAHAQISAIREFLELLSAKRIHLAAYNAPSDELLHPILESKEDLIMELFEIDTAALEVERRALLEYQRLLNLFPT